MNMRDRPAWRWLHANVYRGLLAATVLAMCAGAVQLIGEATQYGQSLIGSGYQTFRKTMLIYPAIDNLLRPYLILFQASRIGVARFHAGADDIGGNKMFYVTYDVLLSAPGMSSDGLDLLSLPASVFAMPLGEVDRGRAVFLRRDDVTSGPLHDLLMRRQAVAAMFVPVRDLSDRVIGVLTISWTRYIDLPDNDRLEVIKRTLLAVGDRVGAYYVDASG